MILDGYDVPEAQVLQVQLLVGLRARGLYVIVHGLHRWVVPDACSQYPPWQRLGDGHHQLSVLLGDPQLLEELWAHLVELHVLVALDG